MKRPILMLLVGGLLLLSPSRCSGVFFELFRTPTGHANDLPSYDPDGSDLTNMMQTAAGIWADVIKDSHDIRIFYRWEDFTTDEDPANDNSSGQMIGSTVKTDGSGRIIEATIRMNKNRTFWVDPSPLDHSEFDVGATLYRDLTPDRQLGWYAGNIPDPLEVGYGGPRKPETVDNQGFPDVNNTKLADADRDLLTLALHELGHALGVNVQVSLGLSEVSDGDYDIDTDLVAGLDFDVSSESTTNGHLNPSSVASSPILMYGGSLASFSFRRLPSATDVIAMGTVNDWTSIDLHRQDWLAQHGFWDPGEGESQGWIGNHTPDEEDDAFVRNGGTVDVIASGGHVENLTVAEHSTVDVNANSLIVDDQTSVEFGSLIQIEGGTLQTQFIFLGGRIEGYGSLQIGGNGANLGSGGTVTATDNKTLTIAPAFDLHVAGDLKATTGSLKLAAPSTSLNGLLEVHGGRIADVGLLTVDSFGVVLLDGSGPGTASIKTAGIETIEIQGELTARGEAEVDSRLKTVGGAEMHVESGGFLTLRDVTDLDGGMIQVDEFALVILEGLTTFSAGQIDVADNSSMLVKAPFEYAGGTITGDADIRHEGNVLVSDDTVIEANIFDMDGAPDTPDHFFTVTAHANLTLNVSKIESTDFVDGYDGTFTVRGRATMNTASPWRLDGELVLQSVGLGVAEMAGSKQFVDGTVTVDGNAAILSDVSFNTSASVQLPSTDDELDLRGETTYAGGNYLGMGTIRQTGDAFVTQDTLVFVDRFDLDGTFHNSTTTINDGVKFSLLADHLDGPPGFVDQFDGVLNIAGELFVANQPNEWTMDGHLHFDDGVVSGAHVIVTGTVVGNGIFAPILSNQGLLAPGDSPGSLTMQSDLIHEPGGTVRLEIAGLEDFQFDQIIVQEDLELLGGFLEIVFIDKFAPLQGQSFSLITVGGNASGDFDSINILNLADGFEFSTKLVDVGGLTAYQLTALSDGQFVPEPPGPVLIVSCILASLLFRPSRFSFGVASRYV